MTIANRPRALLQRTQRLPKSLCPAGRAGTVEGGYALKVNVDWIYLNISVRDRYSNRSIPNLSQEDFLVYENDAPQRG